MNTDYMYADRRSAGALTVGTHDAPPTSKQIGMGILFLASVAVVAVLGSLANAGHTDGWYETVNRVAWSPPSWLFGPAWTVLYVLIACAGFLIWRSGWRGPERPNAARPTLWIFLVQLVLNGLWSPVFFAGYPTLGETAWWAALVIIVALVLAVAWLMASAKRWSRVAVWILVPYILWLAYATSLNAGIIVLN